MTLASPSEPSQLQPVPIKDSVISAKHLTKKFGDETAVQDVSFDVPRASIFGFIGPSGSGKTTTVRLLTGVYTPTDGQVIVLDRNPAKFSQGERARLGYMPQLFVLYPNLTVWENLNFAASLYGMSLFRGKRLKEALKFVELYEHRSKLARNISGGMLRRLSLAATLVHDPQLLFLDEPTAGIDPVLRRKFWDHFRELKNQGRTIFITTQYVSEADNCDLVGVQNNGKLLLVDTPQGIQTSRLRRRYGRFPHYTAIRFPGRGYAALAALRAGQNRSHGFQQHAHHRRPGQHRHPRTDGMGAAAKYPGAGGGGVYAVL